MNRNILRGMALVAVLISSSVFAQKSGGDLLRIGNNVSTMEEFEHMYEQISSTAITPISKQEYLQLFTNYKLKVAEARSLMMDTTTTYKDECKYYIDELSQRYLVDTMAQKRLADIVKARLKEEVKAAHVLITCRPGAQPADTLEAYNKAVKARERVLNGEEFEKVAAECSDDPSAKTNSGMLGYFTAMQMVVPFEDVAYNTEVGKTSEVFRTNYGYHFLHVYDRRESEGEVKVSHIMKSIPRDGSNEEAEAKAKATIDSLYNLLTTADADFVELAKRYSDDTGTARIGGALPWFSRNQIIPEFADVAFSMDKEDQLSEPVKTRAGWHIIKFKERRISKPDEEVEKNVVRMCSNSATLKNLPQLSFARGLAKEYNFKWNEAGKDTLVTIMLSGGLMNNRIARLEEKSDVVLATFDGQKITVADVAERARKWTVEMLPSDNLDLLMKTILTDYEKTKLASKYNDYKYTKLEYEEGLLVFDVTQKNVWSATPDSATIAEIYESNKDRYSVDGELDGDIFFCNSIKDAEKITKLVAKGQTAKAAKIAMKHVAGPIKQGDVYDDVIWPNIERSKYIVLSGTVMNGTPLEIEKCRGQIITDFQQRTEASYVKSLSEKHNPVVLQKIK